MSKYFFIEKTPPSVVRIPAEIAGDNDRLDALNQALADHVKAPVLIIDDRAAAQLPYERVDLGDVVTPESLTGRVTEPVYKEGRHPMKYRFVTVPIPGKIEPLLPFIGFISDRWDTSSRAAQVVLDFVTKDVETATSLTNAVAQAETKARADAEDSP